MLMEKVGRSCQTGLILLLSFIMSVSIGLGFSIGIHKLLPKLNISYLPKIGTMIVGTIFCLFSYLNLPFFVIFPVSIILNSLIITHITNKVENETRLNYVLAFIVAIVI